MSLVHVNLILFCVTADLFKYCYQEILCKICCVVMKAADEEIILYKFGK